MRCLSLSIMLLAIVLSGCGSSRRSGGEPPAASPNPRPTLQQQLDDVSLEATIVIATLTAWNAGQTSEPAVATEAARRYQNYSATVEALAPTLQALDTPLLPLIRQPANATEAARLATAEAVAAVVLGTPTAVASAPPAQTTALPLPVMTPPMRSPEPTALARPEALPNVPAPGSLAGVALPVSREQVEALMLALPDTIDGSARVAAAPLRPEVLSVTYGQVALPNGQFGPRLAVTALAPAPGEAVPPGWSAARSVVSLIDARVGLRGFGRDGELVWAQQALVLGSDSRVAAHTLVLGATSSPWLFTLTAPTPEELDALVTTLGDSLKQPTTR